jgi:hypothetical protein
MLKDQFFIGKEEENSLFKLSDDLISYTVACNSLKLERVASAGECFSRVKDDGPTLPQAA